MQQTHNQLSVSPQLASVRVKRERVKARKGTARILIRNVAITNSHQDIYLIELASEEERGIITILI